MTDLKSKGGLWPNHRKTLEKHPNLQGHIEITEDQIRKLIEMHKSGMQPRIQLAGWTNIAQDSGKKYIGLQAEVFMQKREPEPSRRAEPEVDDDFYDEDIPF